MERGDFGDLFALTGQQRTDTFLHFLGRLVGKRDGKDAFGANSLRDQVRDSNGDDTGFSGASASQHEHGPRFREDSVTLRCVESIQQFVAHLSHP